MDIDEQSVGSSIEICDAIINESWNCANIQKNDKKNSSLRINVGESDAEDESVFGHMWRYFNERAILKRVAEFEKNKIKRFNLQRLFKLKQIISDEETKKMLIKHLMCSKNQEFLLETYDVLKRKYGFRMADCLIHLSRVNGDLSVKSECQLSNSSVSIILNSMSCSKEMIEQINYLQQIDSLCNWLYQKSNISSRVLARIQNLANLATSKVKWSFLIEPGHLQTDLSCFYSEFDVLESFFDKIKLSSDELSQRAFDANYTTKARTRKIECVDCSRVKLVLSEKLIIDNVDIISINQRRPQPSDIFGDCDCPNININNKCGYEDFIHASYVLGGPLQNQFILTQAPLLQTIPDFWRMIWQEKSEYIFMLCDATNIENLDIMGYSIPDYCPYYWPRYEGESKQFGKLIIKNEGLDSTIDSLFSVTHLVLWIEDEPANRLKLQHWQWDWRSFTDFDWPFRLLLRSRHSKYPTIVQCMDGCGRSGTLVLIEIFLMQLLRGTTSYENTMLTSAVFLRLQRRHAVANYMQYLYAYRTVLHWAEPFIVSRYSRFVLGFSFKNSGFIGKYNQIAQSYSRKMNL